METFMGEKKSIHLIWGSECRGERRCEQGFFVEAIYHALGDWETTRVIKCKRGAWLPSQGKDGQPEGLECVRPKPSRLLRKKQAIQGIASASIIP